MKRIATVLTTAAGLWALLALPAPALAQEADFTLNATIDVDGLHEDVAKLSVSCKLCSNDACLINNGYMGSGDVDIPTNGAFSLQQNVVVQANVTAGLDPRDVTSYSCQLMVLDNLQGAGGAVISFNSSLPYAQAKEGSQLNNRHTGTLNQ